MGRLEQLLEENYEKLTSNECKELVIQYIRETESVISEDIIFIKRLTKVANHILESDPDSLEEFLERLFRFNEDGVQKIEKRIGVEGYEENNLISMESHFYAYKGGAAQKRLELAEKKSESLDVRVEWAEKCYYTNIKSADMTVTSDPKHSAHAYSFAGAAAQKRLELAEKKSESFDVRVEWAEKCYNARIKSADMTVTSDPKHSAHAYSFAGDTAVRLYHLIGEKGWSKNAVECYGKFLDYYYRNPDPKRGRLIQIMESNIKSLESLLSKDEMKELLPQSVYERLYVQGPGNS